MELAHRIETKIIVDYYDLEVLIDETYGSNFEIVAQEEANNDSSLTFTVDGVETKYDWEKEELEDFKANKTNDCSTLLILNDMCLRGIIDHGNYLINISW